MSAAEFMNLQFLLFALTVKCAAHGILTLSSRDTADADFGSITFTVFVIDTLACLAIYIDCFTSAALGTAVIFGSTLPKAFAAGLVCNTGIFSTDGDITFGTERVFVVYAGHC